MISILHLFWIVPMVFLAGFALAAIMSVEKNNRMK